jgi:predicted nucleotidyltransferase
MRFGLKEEVIHRIQEVLSAFPQVEEAILYGSRAMGNFRPGSDIDLTLKGKGLDLSVMNEIAMRLDDLLLPYLFDLSVYKHIHDDDLLDHIARVGIIFYKNV